MNNKKRRWKAQKPLSARMNTLTVLFISLAVLLTAALGYALVNMKDISDRLASADSRVSTLLQNMEETQREMSELQKEKDSAYADISGEFEQRLGDAREENSRIKEENSRIEKEKNDALNQRDKYKNTLNASKMVALTFDDGPSHISTPRLLDELKARGVKATFFVLGIQVSKYPEVVKRIADEGHEIACHTWSHANLTQLTPEKIDEEIERTVDIVNRATNGKAVIKLMRPPGGQFDAKVTADAKKRDWRIIKWSVDTRDWETRDAKSIFDTGFQSGATGIQDGAIVLMHDIYPTTVEGVILMIDKLIKEEYSMVTVSTMLELRLNGGIAGEMYQRAPLVIPAG